VTFLVGENGSGKSTLLEAIAVALGLNAEGGSRNFNFTTRASHSDLYKFLRLRRGVRRPRDCYFLRAESYFNLATEIERLDAEHANAPPIADSYGGNSLHEQSHGESFFSLFRNRFGGKGLYLLDEPEAALSPTRQMAFLSILHDLAAGGSQFIIATHSPIIMTYPNASIFSLDGGEVRRIAYEQTEHYKVTRDFLLRTPKMLSILMGNAQTE
jgi:predicted ATPase